MSDAHANSEHELAVETEDITAVEKDEKMAELADLQKSHERPSTLEVEPVSESPAPALTPAGCLSRRDAQLTDRGYFDVKFYHNKLW